MVLWIDISWFIGFVSYVTLSGLTIIYFFRALDKFGSLFKKPFILITQGFFFFILLGLIAGVLSQFNVQLSGAIAIIMIIIGLFGAIMTFFGYKILFDTLTDPAALGRKKKKRVPA